MPEEQLQKAMTQISDLLASEQVEPARKLAADLESAHPERADLAVLSGRILVAQGRQRAATDAFSRAVVLDPLSAEAHYRLGHAAARTGDFERAVKAWEMYVRLSPSSDGRAQAANALEAARTLSQILETVSNRGP
jgi:cytochrome c-type biogenesis protein CcmH/NrfG